MSEQVQEQQSQVQDPLKAFFDQMALDINELRIKTFADRSAVKHKLRFTVAHERFLLSVTAYAAQLAVLVNARTGAAELKIDLLERRIAALEGKPQ